MFHRVLKLTLVLVLIWFKSHSMLVYREIQFFINLSTTGYQIMVGIIYLSQALQSGQTPVSLSPVPTSLHIGSEQKNNGNNFFFSLDSPSPNELSITIRP